MNESLIGDTHLDVSGNGNGTSGATVLFSKLRYIVQTGRGKNKADLCVLDDLTGIARPNELLAIMGPSGSGKTSLLDMISGRNIPTMGAVYLNGQPYNKSTKRKIGFVPQQEALFGTLTVEETVLFAAQLRLSERIPLAEKKLRVANVLAELGIAHVAGSLIGDQTKRGISGGERKRASIACEVVHEPQLLLLDEPTSGLDSSTAYKVMLLLQTLVNKGQNVICTLHQPSSAIFNTFNQLMLLGKGRSVYQGPASQAAAYFSGLGYACPTKVNPADLFLDITIGDTTLLQYYQEQEGNKTGEAGAILSIPELANHFEKSAIGNTNAHACAEALQGASDVDSDVSTGRLVTRLD